MNTHLIVLFFPLDPGSLCQLMCQYLQPQAIMFTAMKQELLHHTSHLATQTQLGVSDLVTYIRIINNDLASKSLTLETALSLHPH